VVSVLQYTTHRGTVRLRGVRQAGTLTGRVMRGWGGTHQQSLRVMVKPIRVRPLSVISWGSAATTSGQSPRMHSSCSCWAQAVGTMRAVAAPGGAAVPSLEGFRMLSFVRQVRGARSVMVPMAVSG
jgi:hypothetical protein